MDRRRRRGGDGQWRRKKRKEETGRETQEVNKRKRKKQRREECQSSRASKVEQKKNRPCADYLIPCRPSGSSSVFTPTTYTHYGSSNPHIYYYRS
jgi:hypothetical protein